MQEGIPTRTFHKLIVVSRHSCVMRTTIAVTESRFTIMTKTWHRGQADLAQEKALLTATVHL